MSLETCVCLLFDAHGNHTEKKTQKKKKRKQNK